MTDNTQRPNVSGNYQEEVRRWVEHCFGAEVADEILTRCFRFFEEAGELCQALGMSKEDAHNLVDYTWGRPKGEVLQEVGGVMVTFAALCTPAGILMQQAGWLELARCWTATDKIRAKQAAKAAAGFGSRALPGNVDETSAVGMWVTLHMAINGDGLWIPQQTHWRIISEKHPETWVVEDQRNDPGAYIGHFQLPRMLCSEPRSER